MSPLHDSWVDDDENGRESSRRALARATTVASAASALWASDPTWPQWVYPLCLGHRQRAAEASGVGSHHAGFYAAPWVEIPHRRKGHRHFNRYPDESIEDWHRRHGLYQP